MTNPPQSQDPLLNPHARPLQLQDVPEWILELAVQQGLLACMALACFLVWDGLELNRYRIVTSLIGWALAALGSWAYCLVMANQYRVTPRGRVGRNGLVFPDPQKRNRRV